MECLGRLHSDFAWVRQLQILTKRPFRIAEHLPPDWGAGYENVWLGVSVEDNEHVWRADVLRKIPACTRFISAEPLLSPLPNLDLRGFHWLIVGGESGPGYRHMDRNWARQLRDMAKAQGVAFFFKQSSGARSGLGDLLDGREWKELPEIPPEPPTINDGEEGQAGEEEVRTAEERPEAEDAAQQREQERQRQEEARLQAEQEAVRVGEMERQEMERLRAEVECLPAERERQRLELGSLQAELEQNGYSRNRHSRWRDPM